MQRIRCVALMVGIVWAACGSAAPAAPKKSEDAVKIDVKADKPSGGKQVVTLTLAITAPWHLYANPVDNQDLLNAQTTLSFTSGGKPVNAKIDYPEGKIEKDPTAGTYRVYEGSVIIKAVLDRSDAAPVDIAVAVNACNKTTCLVPSKVKLKID